jgi:hypothetical protein
MFNLEILKIEVIELEDNNGQVVKEVWEEWRWIKSLPTKQECADYVMEKKLSRNKVRMIGPGNAIIPLPKPKGNQERATKVRIEPDRILYPVGLELMPPHPTGRMRFVARMLRKERESQ